MDNSIIINGQTGNIEAPRFDGNVQAEGTYRTAALSKGRVDGRVSRQWANRPDDQKFLSLPELWAFLRERNNGNFTESMAPRQAEVVYDEAADDISLMNRQNGQRYDFSHWSFGQLCSLTKAPSGYLRRLPSQLAAINLQHGLLSYSGDAVQAYANRISGELRAATSASYGRILDSDVAAAVMQVAGDGIGSTRWKVPGTINWGSSNGVTVEYNPYVDVTKETTTLYASDQDLYCFLVDDTHPIEVGKLPNGEPDLMFRGFIVSNSEVGAQAMRLDFFMLRGVCANRNLWGVEGAVKSLAIRHSSMAPARFAQQVGPALLDYSNAGTQGVVEKVAAAKALKVASNDEEALDWLAGRKLNKSLSERVLDTVLREEQRPARSIWDMVQGMSAVARTIGHQDDRVALERRAGELMAKV